MDELLKAALMSDDSSEPELGYKRYTDSDNNVVIEIDKDTTIEGKLAVRVSGTVIFKGTADSVLTLTSTENLQPAIGPMTRTGMSYGRWSRSDDRPLDKIIVDGIIVHCESRTENFCLGTYGVDKVPEIVLMNGGILVCPETSGQRVLMKNAFPPSGSTKISERCQYEILTPGEKAVSKFRDEDAELIKELISFGVSEDKIQVPITKDNLVKALEVLKVNPKLDVSLLLEPNASKAYIRRAVCILQMPNDKMDDSEFFFESVMKAEFIRDTFFDGKEYTMVEQSYSLIKWLYDQGELSAYTREVMYELIPSYAYNFNGDISHYWNAMRFLEECRQENVELHTEELDAKADFIRGMYCV